jgi:uncharacterized protein (DUF1810 family)
LQRRPKAVASPDAPGDSEEKDVSGLERFVAAQDDGGAFDAALSEMKEGRKRGHWIWYVFPQLVGLGTSHMSRIYGIRDIREAQAYLQHPVLFSRLTAVTTAVAGHVRNGIRLESLMSSTVDAQKLVSSLTLFSGVARSAPGGKGQAEYEAFADMADEILRVAATQGYPRCRLTLGQLGE